MQDRVNSRKRAVNLSIDAELLEEAKAAGIKLSAVLEQALHSRLTETRRQAWREANRVAIETSNAELAENGLWSDDYRVW